MSLKFIDYPKYIELSRYEDLKAKVVADFESCKELKSIYQMGSIKDPGISDLDIICIFKNYSNCQTDYRNTLSLDEKAILTHGLFGIEEQFFHKSITYNLISNLTLLAGNDLLSNFNINKSNQNINTQIAFEYLVKMYITIDVQLTLGIVKLRAFLLLAKAIIFDLELLNINKGKLYDIVLKIIEYRGVWFKDGVDDDLMSKLVVDFHRELKIFLEIELRNKKFYLPDSCINLPLNFSIIHGENFSVKHKGIVLPNQFSFLGKKYINVQNRLNKFVYHIPFNAPENVSIIDDRFQFSKNLVEVNNMNYKNFIPLTTSLSIY